MRDMTLASASTISYDVTKMSNLNGLCANFLSYLNSYSLNGRASVHSTSRGVVQYRMISRAIAPPW